ncbi:hypothetical protein PAAG_05260 [Paracoccidioides lutzii Pb01]|uniref:Aminoglycoside phosphotransferase domain-containing protein n=1 Tax=Paracoccidioides lutzii (strain ATCC MYA-826 / Pb01) TaxID=502779 RepID=C1H3B7_PARBA|nr:hypothetical protein PAAG_05260 [Paracoccidioides lutzii Pb01]EEH34211.2 hypothetical protein PAAG_05260 [Paracoccidioides lutzii Pb01]
MSPTRRLLREEITYSKAEKKEINVLHKLTYWPEQNKFFGFIQQNSNQVEALVANHLGLKDLASCTAAPRAEWMHGSFNLCVPVTTPANRVLVRFPLPYRVGEYVRPGNSDEKVSCEAGTYAWLRRECPSVPVPHLYGFGLSMGRHFTAVEHLSPFRRVFHQLRCKLRSLLGLPIPSAYIPRRNFDPSEMGPYVIVEHIKEEDGVMLSNTWNALCSDTYLRNNLFRDLSRIILTLSRIPLPKIGSFVVDDYGFLQLINRPLTIELQDLENENIPIGINRSQTFPTVDSYVNALLSCHDSRLRHEQNAANDFIDCVMQMSALTTLRAVAQEFFDQTLNSGPFIFQLTDMHASNILVDKNWKIKYIIDLEWAASWPLEFVQPPHWLTSQAVDVIDPEAYNALRQEFMQIFAEEEREISHARILKHDSDKDFKCSSMMNKCWESGTFWYTLALQSPTGLHAIFYKHIQPIFAEAHYRDSNFFLMMHKYWSRDASDFPVQKIIDRDAYLEELRRAFNHS